MQANPSKHAKVVSVQVGRIAPLGATGVPSAFVKCPVDGPVAVTTPYP